MNDPRDTGEPLPCIAWQDEGECPVCGQGIIKGEWVMDPGGEEPTHRDCWLNTEEHD